MYRKGFVVWASSLVMYVISLIPFIFFMFRPSSKHLALSISVIIAATVLYVIGSKMITHKKGYTVLQAMQFYRLCVANGLSDISCCKKNYDSFLKLADTCNYAKGFNIKELYELYSIGESCSVKKKG